MKVAVARTVADRVDVVVGVALGDQALQDGVGLLGLSDTEMLRDPMLSVPLPDGVAVGARVTDAERVLVDEGGLAVGVGVGGLAVGVSESVAVPGALGGDGVPEALCVGVAERVERERDAEGEAVDTV